MSEPGSEQFERPEVEVDTLEFIAEEEDEQMGETWRFYECPNCGHSVHEELDCPQCLWYDPDAWERTLEEVSDGAA